MATPSYLLFGGRRLCAGQMNHLLYVYKLAPPGEYDEMIIAALLMQTVATITVTLVTCSCVVIGAIAEYAELSVHDNYPLRNLGSGTASAIRPRLTTPEFCRTTTFCLTPSVVPVVLVK